MRNSPVLYTDRNRALFLLIFPIGKFATVNKIMFMLFMLDMGKHIVYTVIIGRNTTILMLLTMC